MTYRLKILRQDASMYWWADFTTAPDLNNWLAEEKTRPYWDNTYVSKEYSVDEMGVETYIKDL